MLGNGRTLRASLYWPVLLPTLMLVGLGLLVLSDITIVIAYQLAPASVLAPFSYLEIVSATIFGYLVFNEFPGNLQWLGITIIVSTGLFIFFRERQLELRPAPLGDARAAPTTDLDG